MVRLNIGRSLPTGCAARSMSAPGEDSGCEPSLRLQAPHFLSTAPDGKMPKGWLKLELMARFTRCLKGPIRFMSARMIMLCLDGADGTMLDQYSSDGSLPNLAALRLKGAARSLSAPPGSTDDALWASFQYMQHVGEHGRYYFQTPQKNNQLSMAHDKEETPTFWDNLSTQGMQVAILDVPKCRTPRPLNGIHIIDWLTHGEYFRSPRSFPSSLIDDVLHHFGSRHPHECGYFELEIDKKEPKRIVACLMTEISMKRSAGLHFLNSKRWDLFCIGFSQMHCINHKFWDFDCIPSIDDLRIHYNPIFEILHAIDEAIGAFISSAGPTAECIVFAPTDFERNGSLEHLMPEVISRININLSRNFSTHDSQKWPFNHKLSRTIAGHEPKSWPCTILPYNENFLALRVSAVGESRLFRSSLSAPPEKDLLDAIEKEFLDLRDEVGGDNLIFSITRPSQSHEGQHARNLPDLLIQYPSGHFPNAVQSPSIGRVERQSPLWRKGNHRDGGFIFASGQSSNELLPDVQGISDIGKLAQRVLMD